jgi:hypothetical protein
LTKTQKNSKPKTRELAARKAKPEFTRYEPPPPPPRYQYDPAPGLDPQTRHALVDLAAQVKSFKTLESRVAALAIDVRKAENRIADTPDAWWHHLQVSISTLQKEFRDRVPALERQYANVEFIVSRMDRLEEHVKKLQASIESLLLLDRSEDPK